MDFGKVNPTLVDRLQFKLPPLEKRSVEHLKTRSSSSSLSRQKTRVYVGCPIWGSKAWVGKVYPRSTPPKDLLKCYAEQFNTVELNPSFYQIPDPKVIHSWRDSVGPQFKFCPKVFQGISHHSDLASAVQLTQRFCDSILHFEDRLGVTFLQLPPDLDRSQLGNLARWIRLIPKEISLAVEFRHGSWFDHHVLHPQAYELLSRYEAGAVITDTPGRQDVLHGSMTSGSVLVRFVGNGLHPTDYQRIDAWVGRLLEWMDAGLKDLYFVVHQPDDAVAPDLAFYLIEQLNTRGGLNLKNWENPEQQQNFGFI
jgi:uncharacterized protein YecE (DUF72 family)